MIIGIAGHIDHGKTSLVKALTGVDTDRLKEEKARGITIELGFAYRTLPDGTVLGLVDMPGHERLVHTMLAGAAGIDALLLVVAADDGVMPQTREHLAIADLLRIQRGVAVLSKADRVDAARRDAVTREVQALLAPTTLAGSPVLAVSATTGEGIEALQAQLADLAHLAHSQSRASHEDAGLAAPAMEPASRSFRLAVDRSFSLAGAGTVVTGTVFAGSVAAGDALVISPRGRSVRVRGLQAGNVAVERGRVGQRLALNLTAPGLDKRDIERGDWIVAPPLHAPTTRIDVQLRVLPGEARALQTWTPVHLHLGAQDVGGRVVLLDGAAIAPGGHGWVQLELDRPIGALWGDRFIVRDQSAQRTIGGGVVVDAFAPQVRRHKAARVPVLAAMAMSDPAASLAALLALPEAATGVAASAWFVQRDLNDAAQTRLLQAVPHDLLGEGAAQRLLPAGRIGQVATQLQERLAAHHQRAQDSPGMTAEALQRAVAAGSRNQADKSSGGRVDAGLHAAALQSLLTQGLVTRRGPYLRLAGHEAALLPAEQRLWERVKPWLDEGGIAPPKISEMLARDRTIARDAMQRLLRKLVTSGRVYAVGVEYVIQPQHMLALAQQAQQLAQADEHQRLNVKALRETTGMSRHLSMPLVEFFDHIGFTKRDPIGRKVRRDAQAVFGSGA